MRRACASRRQKLVRTWSPGSAPGTGAARGPRTGSRRRLERGLDRALLLGAARASDPAPGRTRLEQVDSARAIAGCAASVPSMNACDSGTRSGAWLRVGAQHDDLARRDARGDDGRLKSSFSTSPRRIAANASSNTGRSASTSTSASSGAAIMRPKSCIQTCGMPWARCGDARRARAGPCARASAGCRTASAAARCHELEAQRVGRRLQRLVEASSRSAGLGELAIIWMSARRRAGTLAVARRGTRGELAQRSLPRASPRASTSALPSGRRSSAARRRPPLEFAHVDGAGRGAHRDVIARQHRLRQLTLNSAPVPLKASIRIACHFSPQVSVV